jgi:PAS domain S-box-containing protein
MTKRFKIRNHAVMLGPMISRSYPWQPVPSAPADEDQAGAISSSKVAIHFELDGTIVTANENFMKTMGYKLDEIVGRNHSMFVTEADFKSAQYREFWAKLNHGESQTVEIKWIAKGGREVPLEAAYTAILDESGRPIRVLMSAAGVTAPMDGANLADPPFWRELSATTLRYLKWGYGAFGLSIVSYAAYLMFKRIFV